MIKEEGTYKDGEDDALLKAVKGGDLDVVKEEAACLDLGGRDDSKKTGARALMWAAHKGNARIVSFLLDSGVPVDVSLTGGIRALHLAAGSGYVELIDVLLRADADVNGRMLDGKTPLLCAAGEGRIGAVMFLVENGAELTPATRDGDTALVVAAEGGHLEVVKLLISKGVRAELLRAVAAAKREGRDEVRALIEEALKRSPS